MIPIIFENENFVIVDKPAGFLSVPSRMQDKDDRPVIGLELQKQLKIQIFPVHRLDFEVSGILVFAKNASSHKAANNWFENKKVQKVYSCLTEPGSEIFLEGQKLEWKCQLLRGKKRAYESPHGKNSVTRVEFIKKTDRGLVWKLEPITGRSHQLRYEMYRHQMPIVGDILYGAKSSWSGDGIALKAFELHFLDAEALTKFALPKSILLKELS